MKKLNKLVFLGLIIPLFTGCHKEKIYLSFASRKIGDENIIQDLQWNSMEYRFDYSGNNGYTEFLVAVYEDTYPTYLNNIVKQHNYDIVSLDIAQTLNKEKNYGIKKPGLYAFKYNRVFKFLDYSLGEEKIVQKLSEICVLPNNLFQINKEYYENVLSKQDEYVVGYIRETCADCCACIPHLLMKYHLIQENHKPIYVFDMDYIYENETEYNLLKEKYGLSAKGNEDFGYKNGVVPTFQYYKNNVLNSAFVYGNETIQKIGNSFVVTDSYFSELRVNKLGYTTTPLEGSTLSDLFIETVSYGGKEYHLLRTGFATQIYNPYFLSFMDLYD